MKCSATLESAGVRDIGLKSVVKSSIFAFLGNGTTFAYFHILGRDPSAIDELIIILTGRAILYENSRIIQLGILSGPPAFDVFMDLRSTAVSSGEIFGTYESACELCTNGQVDQSAVEVQEKPYWCHWQGLTYHYWPEMGSIKV